MATYACPVCALTAEFEGAMPEGYACPRCACPGERFNKVAGEAGGAADAPAEPAGAGVVAQAGAPAAAGEPAPADLPRDIEADLQAAIERAHAHVGSLLAAAQAAQGAGHPEACALLEHAARETARHAARLAELFGAQGASCVAGSLTWCADEARAEADVVRALAGRAQDAGLADAQAALSEIAHGQERLAEASSALCGRLFG